MRTRKLSKKKDKPLYDSNGRWVEERGRIKGALRKSFRLSPQMREILQEARVELPPALKKDGTPGKRNQVRYKCADCGKLFPQKWVQVDHIEVVVPLWKVESAMDLDEYVVTITKGIFCNKENLQVLCSTPMKYNEGMSSCHKKKTEEENYVRRKLGHRNEKPGDLELCKLFEEARAYVEEKEEKKRQKKANGKSRRKQSKKR